MKIIKMNSLINGNYHYRAHKRLNNGSYHYEKLEDHLELTLQYSAKIIEDKNLVKVFDNIYNILFKTKEYMDLYYEMLFNAIYFHDLGKINPNFQKSKMDNLDVTDKNNKFQDSDHSKYSAYIYFKYYGQTIEQLLDSDINLRELNIIYQLLFQNVNSIYSHHSRMKNKSYLTDELRSISDTNLDLDLFSDLLNNEGFTEFHEEEIIQEYCNYINRNSLNSDENSAIYIYGRLIFGLLTQSDILATMEYIEGIVTMDLGLINNKIELFESYNENNIIRNIRLYEDNKFKYKNDDINELRTKLFIEAEKNLVGCKSIFQLEAPTGAGKTNISINLALQLLLENENIDKVFYAFPFNTLVEQTYAGLLNIFSKNERILNDISIYNSINSFEGMSKYLKYFDDETTEEKNEELSFSKLFRDYQFLYSPIVISTNIKLFDILFGNNKSSYYPLPLIANSIIIMDEIQSYKNSIWVEMHEMLSYYCELLNIKIIIMSATLPSIDTMLTEQRNSKGLTLDLIINSDIYYSDPRFKNRVEIDFSMLEIEEVNYEDKKSAVFNTIYNKITNMDKKYILIEFIKKKTANQFFEFINKNINGDNDTLRILTGDTSRKKRRRIINEIKGDRTNSVGNYILISTQVVEAGVDIDMDIGFKDISLLDSEEQFLGRINRNFKSQNAKAYFFNLDKIKDIYKNDVRADDKFTINNESIQKILLNKDFKRYYEKYIVAELKKVNDTTPDRKGIKEYSDALADIDFDALSKHFRLIDQEDKYTIYLNRKDSESERIWDNYKSLLESNIPYAMKKIKLISLRSQMDEFLFDVYQKPSGYQDYVGSIYYFEEGDQYFLNDEFASNLLFQSKSFDIID